MCHKIIFAIFLASLCMDAKGQNVNVPAGRNQMASAFDTDKHLLLIFGGQKHYLDRTDTLNRPDNKLWSWDGKTWKILSTGGPVWREDAKMVYNSKNKNVYLIGGRSYSEKGEQIIHDEMWEWNGKIWSQLHPAHTPGRTLHTNIVYDPVRNRIVMFGGVKTDKNDGPPFVNDIWEFDGNDWKFIATDEGPSARIAHSMTYSAALKKTLIVSGVSLDGTIHTDLWSWDGSRFELLDSKVPKIEPGPGNAVSVDTSTDVKLFLAGRPTEFGEIKEVNESQRYIFSWMWDGKQWHEVMSAPGPDLREMHVLYNDPHNGRVILYGGNVRAENGYETFGDVWVFDQGKWRVQ